MPRPKKQATKAPKPKKDPRVECEYEEEVTFMCPVRGLVTQKVKIKRFKPLADQNAKSTVPLTSSLEEQLDSKDDGLSIYGDTEEAE